MYSSPPSVTETIYEGGNVQEVPLSLNEHTLGNATPRVLSQSNISLALPFKVQSGVMEQGHEF